MLMIEYRWWSVNDRYSGMIKSRSIWSAEYLVMVIMLQIMINRMIDHQTIRSFVTHIGDHAKNNIKSIIYTSNDIKVYTNIIVYSPPPASIYIYPLLLLLLLLLLLFHHLLILLPLSSSSLSPPLLPPPLLLPHIQCLLRLQLSRWFMFYIIRSIGRSD